MKMLAFEFILAFALVGFTTAFGGFEKEVGKWVDTCANESNIPSDMLKNMKFSDESVVEESLGCFVACLLEKTGIIVDEKLQTNVMNEMLAKMKEEGEEVTEKMQEIIQTCYEKAEPLTERCEIGKVMAMCFAELQKSMSNKEETK